MLAVLDATVRGGRRYFVDFDGLVLTTAFNAAGRNNRRHVVQFGGRVMATVLYAAVRL